MDFIIRHDDEAGTEAITTEELEQRLGDRLRSLRLSKNLDQATVASRAGVSLRTVKNLEHGRGSSVSTLAAVVRALGRLDWFEQLDPPVAVSPLRMLAQDRREAVPRRASKPRGTGS
ncbi:helix-turn-helix transcriptional regulator [Herbiconiux sp.]|uniref:helix-turn-helix domain-containing protein n=1 Tax=Herbiconiux sp. TaxID=1871186 RepID=UPI0025C4B9C3|nr:helix-turn-helix transcriptional regulator [Herbiconiux sp.]